MARRSSRSKAGRGRKPPPRSRTKRSPANRARSAAGKKIADTVRAIMAAEGVTYREAQRMYGEGTRPVKARVFESVFQSAANSVLSRYEFVVGRDGRALPGPVRDRSTGRFVSRDAFLRSRAAARREAMVRYVMMAEGLSRSDAWRLLRDFGDVSAYVRFVRWAYETFGGEEAARLAAEAA